MTGLSEARIHILPCIEHSSLLFFCNSYHATENAHGAIAFTQTVLELITFQMDEQMNTIKQYWFL